MLSPAEVTFNALRTCMNMRAARGIGGGEDAWVKNFALGRRVGVAERQVNSLLGPYAEQCGQIVERLVRYLSIYSPANEKPDPAWEASVRTALVHIKEVIEMPKEYGSLVITDAAMSLTDAVVLS